MAASFLFYDLETSGVSPKSARVMQFAAQRTDMNLEPIGEPYNFLIKLTPDTLPDPEAILVTGITPQQTITDGYSEAEFLRIFHDQVAIPGTVFVGFNSIRFDDEFMRYLHYRNFHDPYEWSWRDDRSRWDMLDVVRMMRALRPEGIQWPFASDGSPTNRLELLAELNGIKHEQAHDALSDVQATIGLARLIRDSQPKLFSYLLTLRDKKAVAKVLQSDQPFVYTSGRYDSSYEKTTAAAVLADVPDQAQAKLVYDLRYNPADYVPLSVDKVIEQWQLPQKERSLHIPVKLMRLNRCPAIAPLSVLNESSQERLQLDTEVIKKHQTDLNKHQQKLAQLFREAHVGLQKQRQQQFISSDSDVDGAMYDAFLGDADRRQLPSVREAPPEKLDVSEFKFSDDRLVQLLPLYKARNYPDSLSPDEAQQWEAFRTRKLLGDSSDTSGELHQFAQRLQSVASRPEVMEDSQKQYLLQELQLYAESIAPIPEA